MGLPSGSVVKNQPANAGYVDLIPGSRRSPGEGNGKPLQCSCLGNLINRGTWRATIPGVTKSWTNLVTKQQQPEHYEATEIQWNYGTEAMQTQEPWLEPTLFLS